MAASSRRRSFGENCRSLNPQNLYNNLRDLTSKRGGNFVAPLFLSDSPFKPLQTAKLPLKPRFERDKIHLLQRKTRKSLSADNSPIHE